MSYVSAYLEKNGFDCKIFDAYFNCWSGEKLVDHIKSYNPDIFGVTAMTHEINEAARVSLMIKEHLNIPAIIGGCHVTAMPERTLAEFPVFDYGIYGEGENTALELLKCLNNQNSVSSLRNIKGLAFRDRENIVVNEVRPFLTSEELNDLPFPAYHNYYLDKKISKTKIQRYVIFTSRGCPYNCAFCMKVLGRKVRRRSAENICREIEHAISNYDIDTIDFSDEIFLFDNKQTREILQLMIQTGLSKRIKWTAQTRANMVNPEIVNMAKRAGCFLLGMGVESGDDKILKAIGKGITLGQVRDAVKIIKEAGITLGTYFIIGHPNETRQTAQKTVDLISELNTDTIAVGIMVPYPGTEIYKMAKRGDGGYRILSEDWSKYDKYGGKALEIKNLSYEELEKFQKQAYINLYLKNFRIIDMSRFLWKRRHAVYYFLKRKITS